MPQNPQDSSYDGRLYQPPHSPQERVDEQMVESAIVEAVLGVLSHKGILRSQSGKLLVNGEL